MIMDGHVEDGIRHATATLQSLPANLRDDGLIHNVAQAALTVVPTPARSLAPVSDFRHLLAATSGGRGA
jgi:lysozyme family protein